ncbi:MAG: 2-oxoglutarate dehydrogenase, E2 component, dihydrolipoamide succinyltransferase [Mycobacteriales bacterium]
MSVSVTMPRLGESVTEGTVTRWLKQEGDPVEADEPLLEVSTDKVDTEIPAPASGVLGSIRVAEDETVEVGVELAVIEDSPSGSAPAQEAPPEQEQQAAPPAQEEPRQEQGAPRQEQQAPRQEEARQPEPEPEPEQPAAQEQAAPQQERPAPPEQPRQAAAQQQAPPPQQAPPQPSPQPPSTDGQGQPGEDSGAYVTPLVRKLAAEHGVDLAGIRGTGVGGRIRKQDVLEAARSRRPEPARQEQPVGDGRPAPSSVSAVSARPGPAGPAAVETRPAPRVEPSPLRGKTEKMSRLRTVIARRMVESLQVSAQLTTVAEVDLTRVARLRQLARADFERREGVKLSFLPFFAVATVEALKQHPGVNASIDTEAGTITYHESEHLGIAVDTDRGLLVPVIHDAGDLNLGGMARKIADLAERTRSNRVSPDELGGGTFTLTNTGSRGALFDTPIINQPQVGILGTGAVVKRPVVVDDPDLGEVIAVRSMVYLALTYDHRIVDGADAARFLVTVKERLEGGAFEVDLGLA